MPERPNNAFDRRSQTQSSTEQTAGLVLVCFDGRKTAAKLTRPANNQCSQPGKRKETHDDQLTRPARASLVADP